MRQHPYLYLFFIFLWAAPQFVAAQLVSSDFGQNRLQREQYQWKRYETLNFIFYYHSQQEGLMKTLLPMAEQDYRQLKSLFEYQIRQPIEVIVYDDYSDLMQSNVGLSAPALLNSGQQVYLDKKLLVHFDGNHQNLHKNLREGIARAVLNRMLFGSNLQEIVQNSVLLELPDWFTEGLIAHAVEEWSTEKDDQLREALLSGRYANFLELAEEHPQLAGQSLFHYIARNYGKATVSNLLYLSRINHSIEAGFRYAFGSSFYTVAGSSWYKYFMQRYESDNLGKLFPNAGELKVKVGKKAISQLVLAPNAKQLAYVKQKLGKQQVVLQQTESQKAKVVWRQGAKDHSNRSDQHYPLLAWRNDQDLAIVFERAEKVYLQFLNTATGKLSKAQEIKDIERVGHISHYQGSQFLLSAQAEGQSDLFLYSNGQAKNLSQDAWDDLSPTVMRFQGKKGVLFSSNRPEAKMKLHLGKQLPLLQFDLFFLPLEEKGAPIRLTNSFLINETHPQALGDGQFSFLSDQSGIYNRYIGQIDSVLLGQQVVGYPKSGEAPIVLPLDSSFSAADSSQMDSFGQQPLYGWQTKLMANTNYSRNILAQSITPNGKKVADLLFRGGKYKLFLRNLRNDREMQMAPSRYRLILERQNGLLQQQKTRSIEPKKKEKPKEKKVPETDKSLEEELKAVEQEIKSDSLPPNQSDTAKVDIDNYLFQTEFEEVEPPKLNKKDSTPPKAIELVEGQNGQIVEKETPEEKTIKAPKHKLLVFAPQKGEKQEDNFLFEGVEFNLDNSVLYNGLDLYLGGPFRLPPLGLSGQINFTDALENYRLELGMRIPITFDGIEYFLNFENRKYRLDQKYSLYRRGFSEDYVLEDSTGTIQEQVEGRTLKHLAMAEFSYPLGRFRSLRSTLSFQADRVAIRPEDLGSLSVPIYDENRLGIRLEYVYDNSVILGLNARKGSRMRIYGDYFQGIPFSTGDRLGQVANTPTFALGLDARHYISLDNKSILAFRFVGASSFGQQKILYNLGGMENWLFSSQTETIPLPDGQDYAYQTVAANMRGFDANIRNGNSFALINAELRIPLAEYLGNSNSNSSILRNLQLTGFYDVGTAWQGSSPFSKDNLLNSTTIDPASGVNVVSPIRLRVNYYRHPIVQGFGFGLRSVVLGYFVKLDCGWGVETGDVQQAKIYLSLGKDF